MKRANSELRLFCSVSSRSHFEPQRQQRPFERRAYGFSLLGSLGSHHDKETAFEAMVPMTFSHSIRKLIDDRLQPTYLAVISVAVIILTVTLAVVMFRSSNEGRMAFGVPLGADFSGFYIAASILNQGQAAHLYDRDLHHKMYHELFPLEEQQVSIPYVHPPFVAGLLKPLARQPYQVAFAMWLAFSAACYIAAMWILISAYPWPEKGRRWLILVLALSFEPFAFECWLSGQLSVIAYLSYAICFAFLQRSRPIAAGVALGICFYKPTLLILILPLLFVGRQWYVLLGMCITGSILAGLSVLLVGRSVSLNYVNELLAFSHSTSGGDLEIRTWKYVDFHNCLKLVLGTHTSFLLPMLITMAIVPLTVLARLWRMVDRHDNKYRRLLWAVTLTWIPLLNVYVGIYDSILIVQGLYVTANSICSSPKSRAPMIDSGLAHLMFLIACSAWLNQFVAAKSGIPIYSILLTILGLWQMGRISGIYSQNARFK